MSEKRQTSKIFVGGLSWETTDQRLRTYFENYGAVSEAFVSFDRVTGRPRGFGFVVFEDPAIADKVVSIQHTIDRREVEAKKAVPKEDNPAGRTASGSLNQRTKKIFVGGLAPSVDEQAFRKYFEQYGEVEDAVVMYDHDNKRPRGFGFVTFATEEGVDEVFTGGALQTLHDKPIEIKRAVPRDQIASARGRTAFNPQVRMDTASSGFAAAAMGPAFQDDSGFGSNLLHSHSLGAPPSNQSHIQRLQSAASMGGASMPMMDLTNQIYQALSGQLSGQLNLPSHTSGIPNGNPLLNLSHANSAHLPVTLSQVQQQLGGGTQLNLSSIGIPPLGNDQLSSANSGLLQRNFGMSNGLNHALSGSLGQAGLLGQDYSNHGLQNRYGGHDNPSAFSNAANDYSNTNHSSAFANQNTGFANQGSGFANQGSGFANQGSGFANQGSAFATQGSAFGNSANLGFANMTTQPSSLGLEKAFSSMALEHKPSMEVPGASKLPPPSGFEDRVNMLSAGSADGYNAGLGQLTSPKLNNYGLQQYDNSNEQHQKAKHDLPIGTQAW